MYLNAKPFLSAGSICSINGYLLVYTSKANIKFHSSDEAVEVCTPSIQYP
jgi:hypothetical protein